MRSSMALSQWSRRCCCSRVPLVPKRVSSSLQQQPPRNRPLSSSWPSPNANARVPQLRVGSMVVHPTFHHQTPSSSSLYYYYNTHYYHTSRPWYRLEHRQRQHYEDQQIQKSAQRIVSLLEPTVVESSSVSTTTTSAAAAPTTTTAAISTAPSTTAVSPTATNNTNNINTNNTNIMIQFLRHLSPHARSEVERAVNKMALHRAHHHQHHHQHLHPAVAASAVTTTTAAPAAAVAAATLTTTTTTTTTAAEAAVASTASTSTSSTTAAAAAAATTATKIPEPPFSELQLLMYQQAIPFVGFGIMDNAILIIAGDAIDTWLGVSFGISTMCAAAIGNIVSDVAGVMLGTVIEDVCASVGLPTPHLTEAQRTLRSVRLANQTGICVGLVIGCIIGMFPLLWIDGSKTMRLKRQAKLQDLVQDVMEEAKSLVQAERTTLFLRVASEDTNLTPTGDGQYLYAKYHTNHHHHHHHKKENNNEVVDHNNMSDDVGTIPITSTSENNTIHTAATPATPSASSLPPTITSRLIPLGRGIVSRSALTGQALNLYHVQAEPDFDPDTFDLHHVTVKNMLCVPVLDEQGRAIAVIQAINKQKQPQPQQPPTTTVNNNNPTKQKTRMQQQQQEHEQSQASATSGASQQQEGETTTSPKENMPQGFTSNDVQILKALASHISIALQSLNKDDADVTMRHTIRTLKEHGTGILEQNQNQIRCRPLFPSDG